VPEGSEVKRLTTHINEELAGLTIKSAAVVGGRYMRTNQESLGLVHLPGCIIKEITCKGKLIVFNLVKADKSFPVLSTLGMTGWWEPNYNSSLEFDKYKRILLEFTNGSSAMFYDPRNFGTFKLVTPNELEKKLKTLGPDILSDESRWDTECLPEFYRRMKRFGKRQTIAEALLDQRISSGCGNYIRADALYLARLSPHLNAASLREEELKAIWRSMHVIARAALYDYHPMDITARFDNLVYGKKVTDRGHVVEHYIDKRNRRVWYCSTLRY
jgi:DNA-formamidopyrimidine glycosylase